MRRQLVFFVVCVAVLAGRAQSQKQPTTPGDVAKTFFSAVAAERWREAAGYLDLDSFERFRRQMIENYRLPQPTRTWTADSLIKHQPDMPKAVADYQIAQMKKFASDTNATLRYQFADIRSVTELAALSTVEAAARMIEAEDIRYKLRLSQEMARCVPPYRKATPQIGVAPDEILGTIVRDSVAYVLHSEGLVSLDSATRARSARRAMQLHSEGREWYSLPPLVMQLQNIGGRWLIAGGFGMLSRTNEVMVGCAGIQ